MLLIEMAPKTKGGKGKSCRKALSAEPELQADSSDIERPERDDPEDGFTQTVRSLRHCLACCCSRTPCSARTWILRCVYGLWAYEFFQICHCAELNKIVEAMMPVNLYDDHKVSLRRQHGNSDLDILGHRILVRKQM